MMEDGYILGGFVGFLFSLALFFILQTKMKEARSSNIVQCGNNCTKTSDTRSDFQTELDGPPEVIVVGAGVAGAALAYALGKDGRRVHVIERDLNELDRIAGEYLHPGGYLKLEELGLQDCIVEDIDAQRAYGYILYKDGKSIKLTYPLEKYDSNVSGIGFHNGKFVQKLREKAAALPNVRLEQGTATSLIEENGMVRGVRYKTNDNNQDISASAYAPLTVVCDGCFSNLRRTLCTPTVVSPSCMVGFTLENCQLPYSNYCHVIMGDPLPFLFYPISSTETRFMIDIPQRKMPSIANGEMVDYLKTTVAPQIPCVLYDAFVAAVDKGSFRMGINRTMPEKSHHTAGAVLLGDALNMRHPILGGGMTVALSDVVVLRNILRRVSNLNDSDALQRNLESFYIRRNPMAFVLNVFAGAVHKIISSSEVVRASTDEVMEKIREVGFDYLSLGGIFYRGPLAFASGLSTDILSIVLTLLTFAVYSVTRILLPFPSPKRLWLGARVLFVGCRILFSHVMEEGIMHLFPAFIGAPINMFVKLCRRFIKFVLSSPQ